MIQHEATDTQTGERVSLALFWDPVEDEWRCSWRFRDEETAYQQPVIAILKELDIRVPPRPDHRGEAIFATRIGMALLIKRDREKQVAQLAIHASVGDPIWG